MAVVTVTVVKGLETLVGLANKVGEHAGLQSLRLLLAYELGEAGVEKSKGDNWFSHVQDRFPFPFNMLPAEPNWFLATWSESLGAVALVVGPFTRFFAVSPIVLTIVA